MLNSTTATVDQVKNRGHLRAGVSKGILGLSSQDPIDQHWHGFDVELARATAAAVLGDADAVEFVPIAPEMRCHAVANGLVDIGTFNASATLGREAEYDVVFPQPMLYDGEAFMARTSDLAGAQPSAGLKTLAHRIVAVQKGATTAANLQRFFRQHDMSYELCGFSTPKEALSAYATGDCNLYALDRIPLTGERLRLEQPEEHEILDHHISKEVMGPVVAANDSAWLRAVTWVMRTLIEAEELGLDSRNCTLQREMPSHVQSFLRPSRDKLDRLGLQDAFPLLVLRQVGNYAEVFANTLGSASPLNLPRLRNSLWSHGGLLISPSFL